MAIEVTARKRAGAHSFASRFALAVVALSLTASALAQGGPPMLTDDPGTPGDGKWEINIAGQSNHAGDTTEYALPVLDINYGVGERIQLNFQVPWLIERTHGQATMSGAGNGQVALKWRFIDGGDDGWQVSMYPRIDTRLPLAHSQLGSNGVSWLVPFEATHKIGDYGVNFEVGRWLHAAAADDTWIAGLAVGREFAERVELIAELHAESAVHDRGDELTANFGLRWKLSDRCTLLASAGTDLHNSLEDKSTLLTYLGLQLNL